MTPGGDSGGPSIERLVLRPGRVCCDFFAGMFCFRGKDIWSCPIFFACVFMVMCYVMLCLTCFFFACLLMLGYHTSYNWFKPFQCDIQHLSCRTHLIPCKALNKGPSTSLGRSGSATIRVGGKNVQATSEKRPLQLDHSS